MAGKVRAKRRIFVFGSNREGRHGLGAALHALEQWGAVLGQAEGLQGNSYGIVTKELRRWKPKVSLVEVAEGIERFLAFVRAHPTWEFILTPIGCGLAGFTVEQIAPMFAFYPALPNLVIPPEFRDIVGLAY